jgi:hypothetical protein
MYDTTFTDNSQLEVSEASDVHGKGNNAAMLVHSQSCIVK